MKKIGILTFHRSYNYGAFIQCYSLAEKIKNDFPLCKIEVIDYSSQIVIDEYSRIEKNNPQIKIRNRLFDFCQDNHLPLSEFKIITDDISQLFSRIYGEYDIVIVGSDAVWNWEVRGFPNAYFLGGDLGAKKMSYAASAHGLDYLNSTMHQKQLLRGFFNDFAYIGVREETTANMVKMVNPELNVNQNCDPSVFLDLDSLPIDLLELKAKLVKKGVNFKKKIIGIMAGEIYGKEIKDFFGTEVQLVSIYHPNKYADVFLDDLNPFEWAKVFSFFDITITHYFHGTMLSIENLTPVIAIELPSSYSSKYSTKIKCALTNMNLMEFHVTWHRKFDVINRILYKLNLRKDKRFWENVCNLILFYIDNPPRDKMFMSLDLEKQKYNNFKNKLENELNGKEN